MLTQFIRVFKGAEDLTDPQNPIITLTDFSMENAEKEIIKLDSKYLYVAQKFPFNNLFMLFGEKVNTNNSKVKIEYWNAADEWVIGVDVLDFTRGAKRNGLLSFQLDNDNSWDECCETDDDDTSIPKELEGKNINDCYWIRISYDPILESVEEIEDDPETIPDETETLVFDVELKQITYAFTTTEKVNGVDTSAPKYYPTFKNGKTDWLEEILIGSEMMIADMKTAGMLKGHGQIILLDDFILPCAYRVLMHIYSQMGAAWDGKRGEVKALYNNFMKGPKTIDENRNAKITKSENQTSTSRIYR